MTTLEMLIENIQERQKFLLSKSGQPDSRNFASCLHDADAEFLIKCTYGHLITKLESMSELSNLVSSMGNCVNRKLKLKKTELEAAHLGWFVFIAYLDINLLKLIKKRGKGKGGKLKKHSSYHVEVTNIHAINSILDTITDMDDVELFPSRVKPDPWVTGKFHHSTGFPLIKRSPHEDAVKAVKEGGMDYLLDTLNKLGSTGWRINGAVLDAFVQCKYLTGDRTPFKFMKEVDPKKRASLEIEAEAIQRLAERNRDNAFYHLYNVDFRGRIYPNTAYLHEQSSDNAKGLLLLDEAVPLGEEGYYWLCVHTANVWGNDKVSLDDRVQWVQDNMDTILGYDDNPLHNDQWMDADKPFCFLACCVELAMINAWIHADQAVEDFPSCLPLYIDGSNNGVQHLTAMSKDSTVAPLVNLVPQDLPGDVYMYIADYCIRNVSKDSQRFNEEEVLEWQKYWKDIVKLKADVAKFSSNPKSEVFAQAKSALGKYNNSVYDQKKNYGPLFWDAISDRKIWRKTVKRPVMVLGYGGTAFGMGEMVDDDTYDINPYLRDKEKAWSAYLGRLIYRTCMEELTGPARMLEMFRQLAEGENRKGKPISYRQVCTGLPFVHAYRKPQVRRVKLKYQGKRLELDFTVWQEATLNETKQVNSAPPNLVHSVDAVHVAMYVNETDYTTTVVHDSFGCHAGNMSKAFVDVRQKFVELYDKNPLEHIFEQMDALHLIPEKGNLDIRDVLGSDFAFA